VSAAEPPDEDGGSSATNRRRRGRKGKQAVPVGAGCLRRSAEIFHYFVFFHMPFPPLCLQQSRSWECSYRFLVGYAAYLYLSAAVVMGLSFGTRHVATHNVGAAATQISSLPQNILKNSVGPIPSKNSGPLRAWLRRFKTFLISNSSAFLGVVFV